MPAPQTSGRFRLINGYWTDQMTPEESRAWKTEQIEKEKAQQAADKERRAALDRQREQDRLRGLDEAVERGKENVARADERLRLAKEAWKKAESELNSTLFSARTWLFGGEVSKFIAENIATGWVLRGLGALAQGAKWASEIGIRGKDVVSITTRGGAAAQRGVQGLEIADNLDDVKDAVEIATNDGFLPVGNWFSPDDIAAYGKRVDKLADAGGLKGGQVVAEGRDKLREQFEAARSARQEQIDAENDVATSNGQLEVAEWDQARAGTHVRK